jgi:Spy/CpxP family protein refolding chaperone
MRALFLCSTLVAACLAFLPAAHAQRPGGGGPPAGGGPGGGPGGGSGGAMPDGNTSPRNTGGSLDSRGDSPFTTTSPQQNNSMSTVHSGLQLGPPGRWWDDKHFVKNLHLRSDQQKRMDTLFDENKANLVSRFQNLQQEEAKMETQSRADSLDESALFAQIDRVAQARAELEKANTHLMLQVRKEMDAEQITRLDKYR